MNIVDQLKKVIAEYNLLDHTFYQAWSQGTLSKEVLKKYSMQYYRQVASFPCFLSRAHSHCEDGQVRKMLLRNLVDEEIHGKDHPSLWLQFAEGMGASYDEVIKEKCLPETTHLVQTYYHLAERDWRDGLCALFAYEYQVPAVSASKIAGLKQHYGIDSEETLEFFVAHQQYDVEHANQVATFIESHANREAACIATREAARALWTFLDGICREHHIVCH
jgi:pyrroloquinoline-quinone synthase